MSMCKFTYANNIYLLDPNKISYIERFLGTSNGISSSSINVNIVPHNVNIAPAPNTVVPSTITIFNLHFDNQDSVKISFQTHTEGMTWIEDNLMSGECPSAVHL